MFAPEVEHESVLRRCVKCVSTPAHVLHTVADAVTPALAQVLSKSVIPPYRIATSIQLHFSHVFFFCPFLWFFPKIITFLSFFNIFLLLIISFKFFPIF